MDRARCQLSFLSLVPRVSDPCAAQGLAGCRLLCTRLSLLRLAADFVLKDVFSGPSLLYSARHFCTALVDHWWGSHAWAGSGYGYNDRAGVSHASTW